MDISQERMLSKDRGNWKADKGCRKEVSCVKSMHQLHTKYLKIMCFKHILRNRAHHISDCMYASMYVVQ